MGTGPPFRRRRLLLAVLAALAVVAGAELAARLVRGRLERSWPDGYQAGRNPNFCRGWPRFTDPRPPAPGTTRLIVISNSQGFNREGEAGDCWPARLKRRLNEGAARPVELANWSVPGGKIAEFTVLAARAAAHRPDAVILVTYTGNFVGRRERAQPLSFAISDVNQLAYRPEVRRELAAEFLAVFRAHDAVDWLSDRSGLVACRQAFVEERAERWTWTDRRPAPAAPASHTCRRWGEFDDWLLENFCATLRRRLPATPIVLVNMPLNRPAWKDEAWPRLSGFSAAAEGLAAADGNILALDAREAVPPDGFITHTHLAPAGHDRFARWLAERLAGILAAGPD